MKKLHNKQHLVSWQNTKKESCYFLETVDIAKTSVKTKSSFEHIDTNYIHCVVDSCRCATNPMC